jgi:hypothetical protein
MIKETIPASRCPTCNRVVVPPAARCPDHGLPMVGAVLPNVGEVVSFTTLYSPPEGFRSPLHIALVELPGGARLFCHGDEVQGMRIGSQVSVEAVDSVFYFSHLGFADRARLFWRRAGARGEKMGAITKSLVKGLWRGRSGGEG